MAKTQAIRQRIRSVRNINQITKAMEMVAASKLRRAQEATLRSRAYSTSAREVLARLRLLTSKKDHPLFAKRSVKNSLIIIFSSDRGLAGAYNSNVMKALLVALREGQEIKKKVIVIGQKGAQFVTKLTKEIEILGVYTNWPTEPTSQDIRPIIDTAVKAFLQREVDAVELIYTDFQSIIKQVVTRQQMLPIDPALATIGPRAHLSTVSSRDGRGEATEDKPPHDVLFEPSAQEVLEYIVPRLLEVQVYQANLEAIASEQAARMVAMKNASDNAGELIEDLHLTYNQVRQAGITQELAEITSGAEAIQ
jgi:F-type H+-transporting ATPase subunit gamma